jgi:hypothetical protein
VIAMLNRALSVLTITAALLAPAAPALASIPSHPAWKSSARNGTWHHQGFIFQNDMWNCPQTACGTQAIWANSARDWGAVSTMAAENTEVLTYPHVGRLFSDQKVSSFKSVRNGFTESMPGSHLGLRAEAADDVWMNHWNLEMMIWVDRTGRSVAGSTRLGSATIFGQHFSVWKFGKSEFIFNLDHNEKSGQTHVLASIEWLIKHGHVPAGVTLTDVEFGWEIASTHGHAAAFHISNYWLFSQKH